MIDQYWRDLVARTKEPTRAFVSDALVEDYGPIPAWIDYRPMPGGGYALDLIPGSAPEPDQADQ